MPSEDKNDHHTVPEQLEEPDSLSLRLTPKDIKILRQMNATEFESWLHLILVGHLPDREPYVHRDKQSPSKEPSIPQVTIRHDGRVPPKKVDF